MIGTWTLSSAVIGFLGFVGINTVGDLKKVVMNFAGMKQDGVEVIKTGNDVEIRKNGKLIIKFDVDSIEEMFEDNTITIAQPDFTYHRYEDFINGYWDRLVPKPSIINVWMMGDSLLLSTNDNVTIKIENGEHAKERMECLAEAYK